MLLLLKTITSRISTKEKVKNKQALQEELGLEETTKFMIGVVSRLTDQEDFGLIAYMMDELYQLDVQLVVLGTGEEHLRGLCSVTSHGNIQAKSPRASSIPRQCPLIYASCDAFLMPSLFEPCGLSQLMSLRYGTLPIVRETGGLKDTVIPYNEYDGTGTGFNYELQRT